jgi:hypothetical protein
MPGMKCLPVLLWSLLSIPSAHAAWGDVEREFPQAQAWVEGAVSLPLYPKSENLIAFTVSPVMRARHFVDGASISVGTDGVIRYTAVIDAAGGARTVSFEGMRCESGERRLYAYGQPDGAWSMARSAGWEAIPFRSARSYQKVLFEEFFCRDGLGVADGAEALRALRQGAR